MAQGLGYQDLVLGNGPTNRHTGIFATAIPKRALPYANLWRQHYVHYLAEPQLLDPAVEEPDN